MNSPKPPPLLAVSLRQSTKGRETWTGPPGMPLSKGKDLAVRSGLQEPALKGFGFRASRGRLAALLPGVARLLSREATGTSDTMRPSVASGPYWGCPRDAMYALYFSA